MKVEKSLTEALKSFVKGKEVIVMAVFQQIDLTTYLM